MSKPTVDRNFAIAYTAGVKDGDALAATKAAYNSVAAAFQQAGREPALVEVRAYAKPKE